LLLRQSLRLAEWSGRPQINNKNSRAVWGYAWYATEQFLCDATLLLSRIESEILKREKANG
jgi:hypothetical protein